MGKSKGGAAFFFAGLFVFSGCALALGGFLFFPSVYFIASGAMFTALGIALAWKGIRERRGDIAGEKKS